MRFPMGEVPLYRATRALPAGSPPLHYRRHGNRGENQHCRRHEPSHGSILQRAPEGQQRLVLCRTTGCRTTSASTAPCTTRRMCCPTHCASSCTPCQRLLRAFSGWIRSPPLARGPAPNPLPRPRAPLCKGYSKLRTHTALRPRGRANPRSI